MFARLAATERQNFQICVTIRSDLLGTFHVIRCAFETCSTVALLGIFLDSSTVQDPLNLAQRAVMLALCMQHRRWLSSGQEQ